MEERQGNRCESCRWCCNGECRFFDNTLHRKIDQERAVGCPFFETMDAKNELAQIVQQLDRIVSVLGAIADAVEYL